MEANNLSEIIKKNKSFKSSLKNLSQDLQGQVNEFLEKNYIHFTNSEKQDLDFMITQLTEKSLKYGKFDKFADKLIDIINSCLGTNIGKIEQKEVNAFKEKIATTIEEIQQQLDTTRSHTRL